MAVRKKYNPRKHLQYSANAILKRYAVGFITGNTHCDLIDLRTNKLVRINSDIAHIIETLRHNWTVYIAVFGIDHQGQPYTKSEEIYAKTPYLQSELVDFLNQEHQRLLRAANPEQVIGAGWIATPYQYQWNEKQAFDCFTLLGAFDERTTMASS